MILFFASMMDNILSSKGFCFLLYLWAICSVLSGVLLIVSVFVDPNTCIAFCETVATEEPK